MNEAPFLSVKNLAKSYSKKEIFEGFSLSIGRGKVIGVIGPSGVGKTTLLKCIAGNENYLGSIMVDGCPVSYAIKNKEIGYAFQEPTLIEWSTVLQNILLPARIGKINLTSSKVLERAEHLLSMVGLNDFRDYYPRQLSGGMKQRLSLTRALLPSPKILLLDEPTSSLDYPTRLKLVIDMEKMIKEERSTAIVVTHDIEEAAYLADVIYIFNSRPVTEALQVPVKYSVARTIDLFDHAEFHRIVSTCRAALMNSYV